jgi:hypothetical protein
MNKLYIFIFLLFNIATQTVVAQKKTSKPAPMPSAPAPQTPAISFGKSNLMYVNFDNPMTVAVDGVPGSEIQVTCDNANMSITTLEEGKFLVKPMAEGEYTLVVTSKVDWRTTNYSVTAKNAPLPSPALLLNATGLRKGGEIAMNVFKGATAMLAQIDNFDFDAKCGIAGFTLTHIAKKGEPVTIENTGPMFNATVVAAIQKCKPGDLYLFSNIKAKIPNDLEPRTLPNTIGYFVK